MESVNITLAGLGTAAASNTYVFAAGTVNAIFRAPLSTNGGAITIVQAHAYAPSGTVPMQLIDAGTAGTANLATICTFGSVFAAGAPNAATFTDGYVLEAGRYVSLRITANGTATGPVGVNIGYKVGK